MYASKFYYDLTTMGRTREQKKTAEEVYKRFMAKPATPLSPSESAAVMAHLGSVVQAQEKTIRNQLAQAANTTVTIFIGP